MPLFAVDIIETYGTSLELGILDAELRQTLLDEATHLTHLRDTREVAFHVGHETGYACLTEGLGYDLQGDGLTCTCGTCDKPMTVGHLGIDAECSVGAMGDIKPSFLI